jgi:GntR family transcriptional regulator
MDDFTTLFTVHPSSGVPIYRQLMEQVSGLIASGRLKPGDVLPSVRQLGAVLDVNFMTISKAWARLEADGVVQHQRGQGMVVQTPQTSPANDHQVQQVRTMLDQAVIRGVQCGLSSVELEKIFQTSIREYSK